MAVYFSGMTNAILKYIDSKIPKDPNKAHIGRIENGRVVIGEASFPYIPTVDLYFGSGSNVACIRPSNTNDAVVVGVL